MHFYPQCPEYLFPHIPLSNIVFTFLLVGPKKKKKPKAFHWFFLLHFLDYWWFVHLFICFLGPLVWELPIFLLILFLSIYKSFCIFNQLLNFICLLQCIFPNLLFFNWFYKLLCLLLYTSSQCLKRQKLLLSL